MIEFIGSAGTIHLAEDATEELVGALEALYEIVPELELDRNHPLELHWAWHGHGPEWKSVSRKLIFAARARGIEIPHDDWLMVT